MTGVDPITAARWIAADHVDHMYGQGHAYIAIIDSVGCKVRQINREAAIRACAAAWLTLRDAETIMAVASGDAGRMS